MATVGVKGLIQPSAKWHRRKCITNRYSVKTFWQNTDGQTDKRKQKTVAI